MRSHAKASTAGSTKRQAIGLGRFLDGILAHRGAALDAEGSSAPSSGRLTVLGATLVAVLAALALIAGPASAVKTHNFKELFGSAAKPAFGVPKGMAIDQATGDVLVIDAKAKTLSRYHADGTPSNFSALGTNVIDGAGLGDGTPQGSLQFSTEINRVQVAIDESGSATDGNIYVALGNGNEFVDVFAPSGAYLGQLTESSAGAFGEVCGVAVDPSGSVYVSDISGKVHKFVPATNPPTKADNTASFALATPCGIAAGAGPTAGFIFVSQSNGELFKLDSSSGESKYQVATGIRAVTVDPATGHVYAARNPAGTPTVNEYDASSAASATVVSSVSPQGTGNDPIEGVAVRESTADIHITRAGNVYIEVFGPTVTLPDVITTAATAVTKDSATLNGTVNPDGVALSECVFEITSPIAETAPCSPNAAGVGSGTSPVAVSADVSLHPGTVYSYRLKAANASGSSVGGSMSLQTLGPVINATWSEDVVVKEATLKASIDPEGAPTTYHFEWGTTTAYGNESPEADVGSDSSSHEQTLFLDGLQSDTTYHYRVVATSGVTVNEGTDHTFTTYARFVPKTDCPNQAFRGGFSAPLPDCRAYEMVSPIDKNGGDILTEAAFTASTRSSLNQSAVSGNKLTYSAAKSFGDQPSSRYTNQYLASRSASGWTTHGINAPQGITIFDPSFETVNEFANPFTAFSEDLSSAYLRDFSKTPLTPNGLAGYANVYRRDNATGSFEALTTNPLLGPASRDLGAEGESVEVQGFSRDGTHVIYMAGAQLTPDAAPTQNKQLYDYSEGKLQLVSVLPDGSANPGNAELGSPAFDQGPGRGNTHATRLHAVSDDGSRIFWSVRAPSGTYGTIYVRIDGQTTVRVSDGLTEAEFWTASADGGKALYTTQLGDLYEFDVDNETRRLIARKVRGVVGASDDLSRAYFVSDEALDSGADAKEGRNLYLDHEGDVTFIATVTRQDLRESTNALPTRTSIASSSLINRSSRVTRDGRHIAFTSHRSLTGYDNTDANNGEADKEVFTYDADADRLICASCNPSGARPVGRPAVAPFGDVGGVMKAISDNGAAGRDWTAAWLPPGSNGLYAPRALSDDGSRLFFNSYDALVPQDTNGVQDVYQWEEQGSGTCQEVGGCVSLISTGLSPERSEFVDATPDGRDVFIETQGSIAPKDPGLFDIYDARAGGGFPPPPAPPTPCVGDACQSVPAAPNDATPASASFRGEGNPATQKARRRCTARKRQAGKSKRNAKRASAKRCKRTNRGAGR